MNHNKKIIKHQTNISLNKLKNNNVDFIEKFIFSNKYKSQFFNNRNRIYTQEKTLSMFISQAINQDGSCQNVVNKLALNRDAKTSISTSGYCKARNRLSTSTIKNLTKGIAQKNEEKVNKNWKFKDRNIYLIDGTTLTMPDTEKNQKEYPQAKSQKEGLGFPICRIVSIISLTTGLMIDSNIGKYSGKETGEQALLRSMLHNFKKGDIVLADAMYSTYTLLAYMIKKEIDIVFVQNGARSRKTDFTQGEILSSNDHIITIKAAKSIPTWMSEKEIKALPETIRIREINIAGKTLITTMLCPKKTTAIRVKNLYKERWNIEVDFRNIKSTLDLHSFKCKSPDMILKEMWINFLAYNLIRTLMLESALYSKILPRQISFKNSLQLYISYLQNPRLNYKKLLKLIGEKIIGNRVGRIEPRALKKRPNNFPLLMKPRNIAREEIRKNGHPKKM
jgi:hypothetical protein